MTEVILKIDGMACSMCESHINDCIRSNFRIKKVSSSHIRGETVILTDNDLDEEKLRKVIGETGYTLMSIAKRPAETKKASSVCSKNNIAAAPKRRPS